MSRVGRKPVKLPKGVTVMRQETGVQVTGPLGTLNTHIPSGVEIQVENDHLNVLPPTPTRDNRGHQGMVRAIIQNLVDGVTKGYEKTLVINGVGYKAELSGRTVTFTLGYTHTIPLELPQGITVEVDKAQTTVKVKGIDKQLVGQIAAQIRHYKIPEPYKAKGVRYSDEVLRRKVGKAGAK